MARDFPVTRWRRICQAAFLCRLPLSGFVHSSRLFACVSFCVLSVDSVSSVFQVADSGGVPPLPIPNREVKPACADGTAKVGE